MNNCSEYRTVNWKTVPGIKPRNHNTKYKISSVFKNLSLSIFLSFSVNDTVYYHISRAITNYVSCSMNINSLKLQGISSTHTSRCEILMMFSFFVKENGSVEIILISQAKFLRTGFILKVCVSLSKTGHPSERGRYGLYLMCMLFFQIPL